MMAHILVEHTIGSPYGRGKGKDEQNITHEKVKEYLGVF